ncbi:MAG: hypothetical protein Q4G26_08370 [Paracoccus sp. (in: a-proteobacteria)]|nr:hypothetical protein [Paracoccus sp. (in: a-proteobacteria)]
MTEPQAARTNSPELGDVLASIRRLIAQEDAGPDFTAMTSRTDGSGGRRSTLSPGPRAERLRSVIERELSGVSFEDERLVLGHDLRAAPETAARRDSPGPVNMTPDMMPAFDQEGYQQALHAEGSAEAGTGAPVLPFTPQPAATARSAPQKTENEMMLAEVNRTTVKDEVAQMRGRAGFDLFAAEAGEEDDQMIGGNALRNLVRDVLTQELQGEMGDRISRNLRRVVRQEVAAVISAGLETA